MRVLITGAGGFIGTTLVERLRARGQLVGRRVEALALADMHLPESVVQDATAIRGDLANPAILRQVEAFGADVVFHLAAIPGGASEADYAAGRRINLDASLALFEGAAASGRRPVLVYASSIAVYGAALPDPVVPDTPLRPAVTYGAHKRACEILLADFSRRGLVDGRSVRLPGIVARPRSGAGLTSAFMSDILQALRAGERFACPVGPDATAWWMSVGRCADNLMHAAGMDVSNADPARAWPLPVLHLSIAQVIDTCAALYGRDRAGLVRFEPRSEVEAVYGRFPRLDDTASRALGLRDDGTPAELVRRALGEIDQPWRPS